MTTDQMTYSLQTLPNELIVGLARASMKSTEPAAIAVRLEAHSRCLNFTGRRLTDEAALNRLWNVEV